VTGQDPGQLYASLTEEVGNPCFQRIDAPATPEQKAMFKTLSPDRLGASTLAGEAISTVLTQAPGNGQAFGGIKVVTENGWFAARPSGTEDVYKIYAESFRDMDHLRCIQGEAQTIIAQAFEWQEAEV
jgi:phosphoglucomutase